MLQQCGKKIKTKSQKVSRETRRGGFLHFPPSPMVNSVKNDLADTRPVKTIKKKKYRFHYLVACNVEITCSVTVIIRLGTLKSSAFTSGGIGCEKLHC